MPVNRATLTLVKKYEGLSLTAYPDPGYGWSIPTIGYGHTSDFYMKVTKGLTITEEAAADLLDHDLEETAAAIAPLVTVPLNENQLGALVSFTFNVGVPAFKRSALLTKLNAGDFAAVADEFRRWNKSNGKVLKGLTRRRAEEASLFLLPAPAAVVDVPDAATASPGATGFKAFLIALFDLLKKVFRK